MSLSKIYVYSGSPKIGTFCVCSQLQKCVNLWRANFRPNFLEIFWSKNWNFDRVGFHLKKTFQKNRFYGISEVLHTVWFFLVTGPHKNCWFFGDFGVQLGPVENLVVCPKFRELFQNVSIFGDTLYTGSLKIGTHFFALTSVFDSKI